MKITERSHYWRDTIVSTKSPRIQGASENSGNPVPPHGLIRIVAAHTHRLDKGL